VYCNFYSRTDLDLIPGYVHCLGQEIRARSNRSGTINTLYFGGGTPSLLPVKTLDLLLHAIRANFDVCGDTEVTVEVNPGTLDFDYLKNLRSAGVNRLSIGVQSFDDDRLKFLGRIHTANQAVKTFDRAVKAGFENISMDLIYGLPSETRSAWFNDLKQAVSMMPSHLSCYMLTIEDGTLLHNRVENGLIHPLGSEILSGLFKSTVRFLQAAEYEQYEISSYSRGRQNRSRHNSKYWDMTPYHGFGAAAHSYDGQTRSWNHESIVRYIQDMTSGRLPVQDQETLTRDQKMLEMIMLRLRTRDGLDLDVFQAVFLEPFDIRFKEILDHLRDLSFGTIKNNRFSLSLGGRLHLNSIVEGFVEKIG